MIDKTRPGIMRKKYSGHDFLKIHINPINRGSDLFLFPYGSVITANRRI